MGLITCYPSENDNTSILLVLIVRRGIVGVFLQFKMETRGVNLLLGTITKKRRVANDIFYQNQLIKKILTDARWS